MHGFDWQSHSQGTVLSVASPMLRQVEQNIGESVEAQLHLDGKALDVTYGIAAQSDILTTVGLRDNGETLGGYALSNLTAKLSDDAWSLTFYVDNLFDKYAFVSTRGRSDYITDANNRPDLQRGYSHYLLKPRTVGLKFDYNFGL
ncbi:MAG: TonB-dependent receptor [Alteromonadaceae bacterium TMED7]|nr:MAG: TonB-dependent receptor [Alteromonadaceae bacterium TMED7]